MSIEENAIEENKELVRRWIESWNGDAPLQEADDYFASDWRDHNPLPGRPEGIEGARRFVRFFRDSFGDIHMTIDLMVAEGDRVAVRWIADATHIGEFNGIPPSGRRVTFSGISVHRIRDGKIAETADEIDFLGLLQQVQSYTTG